VSRNLSKISPEDAKLHRDASYLHAKNEARKGNWRPYWEFQWPDVRLDEFQEFGIEGIVSPGVRDVFMKGCTGCGKTASVGMGIVCYYDIWDDARIRLSSSTSDHAARVLFGEVRRWWQRATYSPPGNLQMASIWHSESHRLDIINPEKGESAAGDHGEHVLFSFDEASSISDEMFTISDTQCKKLICMMNPRSMSGRARDSFPRDDPDKTQEIIGTFGRRRCITIPATACTNVKEKLLATPIAPVGGIQIDGKTYKHGDLIPDEDFAKVKVKIPGQIDYGKYMGLLNEMDEWSIGVFVHAKFPKVDAELAVVNPEWLGPHRDEWINYVNGYVEIDGVREEREIGLPLAFGLDAGGSTTGDPSVLTPINEKGVVGEQLEKQLGSPQEICAWVISSIRHTWGIELTDGDHPIAVDMDGLGWGVGQDLVTQGVWVIEIRGNGKTDIDNTLYANKRAELYGEAGNRLNPNAIGNSPFAIPDEDRFLEELVTPEKIHVGHDGRKFHITPKKSKQVRGAKITGVMERLGVKRSPDRADSFVYAYGALQEVMMGGSAAIQMDGNMTDVDTSWLDNIPEWSPNPPTLKVEQDGQE